MDKIVFDSKTGHRRCEVCLQPLIASLVIIGEGEITRYAGLKLYHATCYAAQGTTTRKAVAK